ncbi:hypothetical protein [Aggregatilinea lenta]|uniref:hypothetical protein n=1 Tax=Aggregatilinea lenta TaxID=913108 RepID=UPI000E5BC580|nr:hypothetical protein [Aggregatilinea lenta]
MNRLFGGPERPDEDDQPAPRPMQPLDRSRPRTSYPPQAIPLRQDDDVPDEDEEDEDLWEDEPGPDEDKPRASRQDLDPVFGYVLAMALSVGLTPIDTDTRYILLWTFLALMGGMAFVLGGGKPQKATDPGDLVWGLFLGGLSGGALMLVGGDTLAVTSERLFGATRSENSLLITWAMQATLFVMPLAETLFFRGAMQRVHTFLTVALLASLWSVLLFFPALDLGGSPAVAVVYGAALVLLNFLYGYVNFRHGLAASLVCQITAGSLLLLAPMVVMG